MVSRTTQRTLEAPASAQCAAPRVAAIVLMTMLAILPSMAASAGEVTARFTVSAQVIARAILSVDNQPSDVVVTDEDVARGYVDLALPMLVNVRTNSRSGYLLQVAPVGAEFSAVDLRFGDSTISVSSHESAIARPYRAGGDTLSVNARLTLAPDTLAGRHAAPFELTASPL